MLAVADRGEGAELAAGGEQRHGRVAEPERRELLELGAELERELLSARHDRVDPGHGREVVVDEQARRVLGERVREQLEVLRDDREARGGAVAAPPPEQPRAGGEPAVQVEGRDGAAGALPLPLAAGDQDDGTVEALDEPGGHDADHALVPVLPGDDVRGAAAFLLGPRVDLGDRLADDPALDGLPFAVQLLERVCEPAGVVAVVREQQLERGAWVAEPAGRVDARAEPEADGARVDGGRVDPGGAHERLEAGPLRPCERAEAGCDERSVLVQERDDVGDRGEGDEVEVALRDLGVDAEERLAELVDDAGAAQLRERIVGGPRRDDRAIRERLAGPVVVGDDHLEAARRCFGDLGRGGDAAVDGEHEAAALVGEPRERLGAHAVAFVEPAREVPVDVGAELAQEQDGERGGGDAVDVVVAVDADPPAVGDGGADPLTRERHVAEQERVVRRLLAGEEQARPLGVVVAAADEHGGRQLADPELAHELRLGPVRTGIDRPGAVAHRAATLRAGADGSEPRDVSGRAVVDVLPAFREEAATPA